MRNRVLVLAIAAVAALVLIIVLVIKFSKVKIVKPQDKVGEVKPFQALLLDAKNQEQEGDFLALKSTYQKLTNNFIGNKDISIWQKKLDGINIALIFSPIIVPGLSQAYQIQPLDTLTKISRQFNTTVDLLKKSNNLSSDIIISGRRLKVWTGRFSVLVDKSLNALILKSNDEIIKTYHVSTGLNSSTPIGTFTIVNKLLDPVWYKSGAIVPPGSSENILGTRWLGFNLAGYGIHGTTDPDSIGKQATAGCVRMLNQEVEELYILLPVGTEVVIIG